MSIISVKDAREFADVLLKGAEAAERAGQTEFDLTDAVDGKYDAAHDELQAAIDAKTPAV